MPKDTPAETLTKTGIARAFSLHEFTKVYDYLDDAATWHTVGSDALTGKAAVIAACADALAYFATVTSEPQNVQVWEGSDFVALESTVTYNDSEGDSTVACCDVYAFRGGKVVGITSYNVEVQ